MISSEDRKRILNKARFALERPRGFRILCPFCWWDHLRTLFIVKHLGLIGFLVLLAGGIHTCRIHGGRS